MADTQGKPMQCERYAGMDADACLAALCSEFDRAWNAGSAPQLEEIFAQKFPAPPEQVARKLIIAEIRLRRACGEQVNVDDYLERFPQFAAHLAAPLIFELDSVSISLGSTVDEPLSASPATQPAFDTAPIMLGRYRLQTPLGRGGFGEVWQGVDPQLQRPVAIKFLRSDRRVTPAIESQFLEEGRKLAQLNHPGIVSIYDVGRENGRCYLVSELVEGGSLHDRLSAGRIPVAEAVAILADAADALHYAHLNGLVHRDVKPKNILIGRDGRVRLADFGLAVSEEEQLDEAAAIKGTLSFMSPEQLRGNCHHVDSRSDIYSLGIVAYVLLTGRLPFVAKSLEQFRDQVLNRDARPPRTIDDRIPPELERICLKCLRREPADRYTTGLDLARELRAALTAPVPAPATAPKSHRLVMAVTGICLLSITGATWLLNRVLSNPVPFSATIPETLTSLPQESNGEQVRYAPGKWINLLEKAPSRLIWPTNIQNSHHKHTAERRELMAACEETGLFELGLLPEHDCVVQVSVHQFTPWTGGFGVFFGFQNDDQVPGQRKFQLVEVVAPPINKKRELHLNRTWTAVQSNGEIAGGLRVPIGNVSCPQAKEEVFELRFSEGILASVRWGKQEFIVHPSANDQPNSQQGRFGLYVSNANATFRNASILVTPGNNHDAQP